jgi:hydrogenase-1 operon protein HyaE
MTIPIPMPVAPAEAHSHPLIARLIAQEGVVEVDAARFDAFVEHSGHVLLVFTEDPVRFKETLDLAVIVPELMRAFAGRFTVGVLLPEAARIVAVRYGFRRWPALVLLRDGHYVGAVDGLREWGEFVAEIARLLDAPPARPPSIGIAVTAPGAGPGGCAG